VDSKTVYVTVALRLRADADTEKTIQEMSFTFQHEDEKGRVISDYDFISHEEQVD
jgi:hypothetical protein